MKNIGVVTTSLLLTASLVFYSGRSNPETSKEQFQPQHWVTQVLPFKERGRKLLRPFLMKVKSLTPID